MTDYSLKRPFVYGILFDTSRDGIFLSGKELAVLSKEAVKAEASWTAGMTLPADPSTLPSIGLPPPS